MRELYSFDIYRNYTVVVEPLDCGGYEGVAYVHSYQNPVVIIKGDNGDYVREQLINHIDSILEGDV